MDTKIKEIEKMKMEMAKEYGVADFEDIDRGSLTSRVNGNIIRTLIEMAEKVENDKLKTMAMNKKWLLGGGSSMEYNRNNLERLGIKDDADIKEAVNRALEQHDKGDLEIDRKNKENIKFKKGLEQ